MSFFSWVTCTLVLGLLLWILLKRIFEDYNGFRAKSGLFKGVIRVVNYDAEEVAGFRWLAPEEKMYVVFEDPTGKEFVSEGYHSSRLPSFLRWISFSPKGYIHSMEGLKSFLKEYPPSRPAGICYWLDKVIKGMRPVEDAQTKGTYSYMFVC